MQVRRELAVAVAVAEHKEKVQHLKAELARAKSKMAEVVVHMGREHASREKKLSMVNFFNFVQKHVSRIRFQEIKIRP